MTEDETITVIDDAEIYIMKAMLHSLRGLFYVIATYNVDAIHAEIEDADFEVVD